MLPGLRGPDGAVRPRKLLARVAGVVVAAATITLGIMFSVVILAVGLAVGLVVFGWLWWRMRRLLKQARQDPRFTQDHDPAVNPAAPSHLVIEGEVIKGEWKSEREKSG
jgi:hypothetical protein